MLWPITTQANTAPAIQTVTAPLSNVVAPWLATLKVRQPQFPDRREEYQALVRSQAAATALRAATQVCEAQGGTYSPSGCYIPPPPPKPVYSYVSYANGYDYGNCTWFVANQRSVPGNWGNANNWFYAAQSMGWAVGYAPRTGSIAWTAAGWAGHVALVIAVSGNQIEVSEMNVYGLGVADTRWTNFADWGGYIY